MQESTVYHSIFAEGETSGEQRKQREIANNLLREGLSIEVVARGTGLSVPLAKRSFPKKSNNCNSRLTNRHRVKLDRDSLFGRILGKSVIC